MNVAIINYNAGNLASLYNSFLKVSKNRKKKVNIFITEKPYKLKQADKVILPGVGDFSACKNQLIKIEGMVEAINDFVFKKKLPFLGICIGMQLMAKKGFEFEPTNGLNWINGQVERIQLDDPSLKIPHMGWNEIAIDHDHAILKDIKNGDHFYFVHSYQMRVFSHEERLAHVDYGGDITAIVAKDNMVGLQLHPEKSSQSGMKLIKNFLEWAP